MKNIVMILLFVLNHSLGICGFEFSWAIPQATHTDTSKPDKVTITFDNMLSVFQLPDKKGQSILTIIRRTNSKWKLANEDERGSTFSLEDPKQEVLSWRVLKKDLVYLFPDSVRYDKLQHDMIAKGFEFVLERSAENIESMRFYKRDGISAILGKFSDNSFILTIKRLMD